ncbi:MAG: transposase [Salinisphaera sp.]|uniref:IS66 family insertion sequence element accessory protein TnpA n=1 Tax=Salinisphaera sp. TaxID=1914330 RepID=UPI003C7A3540
MADPVRRRRSPEQWQRLIDQQADSGQSQAAFCAAHGLSQTTFQHWKRRLKSSASPVEALFTPLTDTSVPNEPDSGWTIELDLGDGVCLRLRRGGW